MSSFHQRSMRGYSLRAPKSRDPNIDEVAVERAMAGDWVTLTLAERAEVVRRLTDRGLAAHEIARRLRVAPRTVVRYRVRQAGERA
jgi:DNA-binding NarL/FixJ family response regulator